MPTDKLQNFLENLPDADSAKRFAEQFAEKSPSHFRKLEKNEGLLSDVLTIAAYSPLLSTTILQNPNYVAWLETQRKSSKVRGTEEILESLARFALTNSTIEPNILLARFRRRELLRIYLQDIRGLNTIAEITEEISILADAILEHTLQIAQQEMNNRFGIPQETDDKGRAVQAEFCIVALGKLGSKELNYSSDIDLLFLYSAEGETSGKGTRGRVTNREYFVKLSETIVKLVGAQTGEGAAYRVDMRLRPNGRVGALAISLDDAVSYYKQTARDWEKQVLIRSRACAGETEIFQKFFSKVEDVIFSKDQTVENALENVRLSKEKINLNKIAKNGFDVKLGTGGIREIEFIAQALQLAHGGHDEWLRVPHTLKSLVRLADRNLLTETELTELAEAYKFLRRVEHRLQMENGLQSHLVSDNSEKRFLIAKRMNFSAVSDFDKDLKFHTANVNRIFERVFDKQYVALMPEISNLKFQTDEINAKDFADKKFENRKTELETAQNLPPQILSSLEKSDVEINFTEKLSATVKKLADVSQHFTEMLAANPGLIKNLPDVENDFQPENYLESFLSEVKKETDFAHQIAVLRKIWSRFLLEIVTFDVFEKISLNEAKQAQTRLAEASIETAIFITRMELEKRFAVDLENFPFAVLALGKLGGKGVDYGSDLDLVLVYDEVQSSKFRVPSDSEFAPNLGTLNLELGTFYVKAVEIFVNSLSAMTREGHLYRVDLRLRPDGKNGATSLGKNAFLGYLKNRSAIWEWLAYVKIRGVAGDMNLADYTAREARNIIHENALEFQSSDENARQLKAETVRIRENLEKQKSVSRWKSKEIDIKFGEGGMLDVYFAVRFLQLRDNLPDSGENRSTVFMLEKLFENGSIAKEDYENFSEGYEFLSELDHSLRLTVGRSTRLPLANRHALKTFVERMKLESIEKLLEQLTFHRLNIRASFENILKS
ncbi:MAG: hypothetical protein ACR2F2_12750 [Pyrinomonadaceae bacterium]